MKQPSDLRIVFMGTPGFAVGVLDQLVEHGYNIVGVITAIDKPAGRGRKLRESAVKTYALSKGLHILQPRNLKDADFLSDLQSLNADLQIIVAFRMLPRAVWDMPRLGTFNLHASLLPQYRGAAPINWAIINGERETGVTTFFIDDKIDTGAILLKKAVSIEEGETAGTLHDKLMITGGKLVLETVELIASGEAVAVPQEEAGPLRSAPKLNNDNTRIDWSEDVHVIDALIRGLSPYPVAWTELHQDQEVLKVKVYRCTAFKETHDLPVGSILTSRKEIKVAAGDGFLRLDELQLAGRRKMDAISLLNGFAFSEGAKMS